MTSPNDKRALRVALPGALAGAIVMAQVSSLYAFDVKAALASFKKCRTCHEIGDGAKNKVGPQLNGLKGRSAAGFDGFKYSKALRDAAEAGLVWDEANLDQFLKKPRTFVKGTRMSFTGLNNDDTRTNLVKWLLHFSPDGSELAAPDTTLLGAVAAAMEGDPDYGKYLSGECVTCHQLSGGDSTIPAITGWPKENFIHALYEYKTKARDNPVMQTVTGRLGDEELAALAAYFGSLPAQ